MGEKLTEPETVTITLARTDAEELLSNAPPESSYLLGLMKPWQVNLLKAVREALKEEDPA